MKVRNSSSIEMLIASPQSHMPRRVDPRKLPRRLVARRCHCGQCASCVDNARWERVFQQKFADPDYYGPRMVRHSSPLDALG
ncbi:hypothetical protein SBA4_3810013 [Candidatus Sulfopaludibacter sp. SbA4]|nr:hypothetical protein SBA4_3810013 [Candidatus Sulfopaludibacter sp. SbA4]